ncbi:RNA polymerase II mediator complex subunit [Diatrype stigma]|uniref:Mediator of RNA polymerase II transcription subunit 17 n=1 Tax=Diatrype stigma TaxID=117547 RepID=A0AAN9UXN2_9PEZI
MASTSLSHFSLRPWPTADKKKPKNIREFVSRISIERGTFRNVPTEAELREEVEQQAQQVAQVDDDVMEGLSESEDDADADKSKSAWLARQDLLAQLEYAFNHSKLALEFVSLLISKEDPTRANKTMSHELREIAGIGTLGASMLKDSNMTVARLKDDTAVGTGWKLIGTSNMVNSVTASLEKLEEEMLLESRYWDDISAIRMAGFRICRLPHEPRTLAVRYGFPESAPMFYEQCTGPLRRSDDGSARLVTGPIGRGSKRLRVTIETNGRVTGITALFKRPADDAPIQRRVIEARITASSQEIWHELNREARMLLSLGVRVGEYSITWDVGHRSKVIITLEDQTETDNCPDLPHNLLADSLFKALFALKLNAHAQNYKRRTYPQPPAPNRTNPFPEYSILRPFIAHARHLNAFMELASFLDQLIHLLHSAGVTAATSTYTRHDHPNSLKGMVMPSRVTPRTLEFLASQVFLNKNLVFEVNMSPEARVQIQGGTYYMPHVYHRFAIVMPSRAPNQNQLQRQSGPNLGADANANGSNTATTAATTSSNIKQEPHQPPPLLPPPSFLEAAYPPPTETYSDHLAIMTYLKSAAARVLAAHLAASARRRLADQMRDDGDGEGGIGSISWAESMHGPAVTVDGHPERDVWVSIAYEGADPEDPRRRRLVLRLDSLWRARLHRHGHGNRGGIRGGSSGSGGRSTRSWAWNPYGGVVGGEAESPEDVVFGILTGEMM